MKAAIDWTKPKEALAEIKKYIIETAECELKWYANARWLNALLARSIRFVALILLGLGLLLPLLGIDSFNFMRYIIITNTAGYFCLAMGGIILLFDKYFGLSSGFIRFYIAEEEIKKNIGIFELAWEIEMVKSENCNYTAESILNTLALAKVLRLDISNTIQVETSAWASEFQSQIGELQEFFKQQTADYKKQLGAISVKVENSSEYKEIELILDEVSIKKLSGSTSAIFRDVLEGIHQIQIRATKNDKIESFSQNFEVSTSKIVEVTLKLP